MLGAKAPKKQRTVAEDAVEILEASHYQDLPKIHVFSSEAADASAGADASMSQYVAPCSVSQICQ